MLGTGVLRQSNSEVVQPKEPGVWDLSKGINYLHEDKTCYVVLHILHSLTVHLVNGDFSEVALILDL